MAVAQIAAAAGRAAMNAAPTIVAAATEQVKKATGGKLKDLTPQAVVDYIGSNPQRLTVVADGLIRAGIAPDDIFPTDLVMNDVNMKSMRDAAAALAARLNASYAAKSDRSLSQSVDQSVADVLRVKRVMAILSVYGSAENYFLCHPNGGVPMEDFAYHQSMKRALLR